MTSSPSLSTGGGYDGSWDLTVSVPRLETTTTVKVKGNLHIGGLLLKISETLQSDEKEDWSDYALWWPERNAWLLRTRSTLDQCGVQGSSVLEFTQMHKQLHFFLPDLRLVKIRTNFSVSVFRAVIQVCKKLDIRHPEELSISRKLDPSELKRNQGVSAVRRAKTSTSGPEGGRKNSLLPNGSELGGRSGSLTPAGTIDRGLKPFDASGVSVSTHSLDCELGGDLELGRNPGISVREALQSILHCPKNYVEKARINAGWLDSSRSLMEQGIREEDAVLLRVKFFHFYDLNPKCDRVRINQIYQQMRWSLMCGEYSCTEDEMLVFAALQVQVDEEMQRRRKSLVAEAGDEEEEDGEEDEGEEDEGEEGGVDAALDSLQDALDGGSSSSRRPSDITKTPQLQELLSYYMPKKLGLKSYKKGYFVLRDVILSVYKDESKANQETKISLNLTTCEVSQTTNFTRKEFLIKLLISDLNEAKKELIIRLDTTEKYAKWLVAFKLATKGRTMADGCYEGDVESLKSVLNLQRMSRKQTRQSSSGYHSPKFDPATCVAPRILKKMSAQEAVNRISAIHSHVSQMSAKEAQLEYIRAWQQLPETGNTYFVVKFENQKKEELLAISPDHMARLDISTGEPRKTWSYTAVENWSVNWDTRHVHLQVNGEKTALQCYTADCKTVHEFIGAYIFLMLRSPDKGQGLDEEYFQKLTGGRD